tara:strand:- start:53 stop:898 length:846 start_codon:yes stop_codon:yes gene_type:complete
MPYTQHWGISRNAFQSPLKQDEETTLDTDKNLEENVDTSTEKPSVDIIEQNNDNASNITSLFGTGPKNTDIGWGEGQTPPSISQGKERSGNWFSNLWDDTVTAFKNPTRIMGAIKDNDPNTMYNIQQDQDARKKLKEKKEEGVFFNEYDKANLKALDNTYSGTELLDGATGFIPPVAIAKGIGLLGQGGARGDADLVGEGAMNVIGGGILNKLGKGTQAVANMPINPKVAEGVADVMKADKYLLDSKPSKVTKKVLSNISKPMAAVMGKMSNPFRSFPNLF